MYWTNLLPTAVPAVLWVMCDKVQHIEELNNVYECVWERVNSKKCTAKSVEWPSTPFTAHPWSALHWWILLPVAQSQRPSLSLLTPESKAGKLLFSHEDSAERKERSEEKMWHVTRHHHFSVMEQETNELEVWCTAGPWTSRSSPSPLLFATGQLAPCYAPSPGLINLHGATEGWRLQKQVIGETQVVCNYTINHIIFTETELEQRDSVMTYRFSEWVMGSAHQQNHASLPTIFICCWKLKSDESLKSPFTQNTKMH